jgi:hypothetical protein
MELVPIIYNSLLVVSVFLFSVVFISLACSKLNLCGKSKQQKSVAAKREYQHATIDDGIRFEENARDLQREYRPIINHHITENQVRVSKSDSLWDNRVQQENNFQSISRYSVVNANSRVLSSKNDIYAKFSKMSVEYSQTA